MIEGALYFGLFVSAFVSATLFPGQSEAVLAGLVLAGHTSWLLLIAASVGNILGSLVNWLLGRGIERFGHRRWFPASPARLERAQRWYAKCGRWSLLMSWAPVIGDPLTLVAGVMREPLPVFLALVSIAKVVRYLVVIAVAQGLAG